MLTITAQCSRCKQVVNAISDRILDLHESKWDKSSKSRDYFCELCNRVVESRIETEVKGAT